MFSFLRSKNRSNSDEVTTNNSAGDISPRSLRRLRRIHQPRDCTSFIKELSKDDISAHINERCDFFEGAPIHSIVRQSSSDSRTQRYRRCPSADCLIALLKYDKTDIEVNHWDSNGCTPLHIAVQVNCVQCAEALLTFGADPVALDKRQQTPIDIATIMIAPVQKQTEWTFVSTYKEEQDCATSLHHYIVNSKMREMLISVGGDNPASCAALGLELSPDSLLLEAVNIFDEGEGAREEEAGEDVDGAYRADGDISSTDGDHVKEKPVTESMQTQNEELVCNKAGARVLSLDGGGMKGLIEIDTLEQLILESGKEISEMFDWIVATSTGAIIILALLYAKKSLKEIRKLYFQLRDVFASPRFGVSYNTSALEKILISVFGTDMTMEHDSENMPKVIITAVKKKNNTPELQCFSNCLNDDLCKTPVWKVARCTSAAPLLFEEFEGHVDGGVLANNPCQVGLTKIEGKERLPLSLVVSVGTGINSPEKLGSVNAQQYLYYGSRWPQLSRNSHHEDSNLAELLSNAFVESEEVAHTTQTECRERGIKFYRISPALDENIVASETSNEKLCHMVVIARAKCKHQIKEILKIDNE